MNKLNCIIKLGIFLLPFNTSSMDFFNEYKFSTNPELDKKIHDNIDLIDDAFCWTNEPEISSKAMDQLNEIFTENQILKIQDALKTFITLNPKEF